MVRVTDKKLTAKLLNGLVLDGTLVLVEKGVQGGRKATRYRFNSASPNKPEC